MSANHWMFRLYRWTFQSEPRFIGYCPLFWISWFCILISPFVAGWRAIKLVFAAIGNCFDFKSDTSTRTVEKKEYKWPTPGYNEILALEEILKKYKLKIDNLYSFFLVKEDGNRTTHYLDFETILWAQQNEKNLNEYFSYARRAKDSYEKRQRRKEERAAKQKEYLNLIIKYTSWVVKPLMVLSLAGVGYLMYLLFGAIISAITFEIIFITLKALGILVAAFTTIFTLFELIKTFGTPLVMKLESIKIPAIEIRTPTFLEKFCIGVAEVFDFLTETIKMTYKKECPLIEISDETGPIERREQK